MLVLHELFDNAREHGAWAKPGGRVTLSWETTPTELVLHWLEPARDSEPHPTPDPGMGLTLVQGIVERQLSGRFDIRFDGPGVQADLAIPWKFVS